MISFMRSGTYVFEYENNTMGDVEPLVIVILLSDMNFDALISDPLVHLIGPVLDTLLLAILNQFGQHDNHRAFLLGNHTPKVFNCIAQWRLSRNEGTLLIVAIL